MNDLGVVLIGRNEGPRLLKAMESVRPLAAPAVYVDSGSSDGSVAAAEAAGFGVAELDRSRPFTAARARNAGAEQLLRAHPTLTYLFFMDGDCELIPGFIDAAVAALRDDVQASAACGRRRERFPQASGYNRLCDMEWNTPVGTATEFGGDVVMRADVFQQLKGYNARVIAGEDSEFAVRMRGAGWKILRIDHDMTWHDAAIMRFGQWRKRTVRSGHALAQRASLHGAGKTRDCVAQQRSVMLWGGAVPLAALALAWPTRGLSLFLFLGYLWLLWRIFRWRRHMHDTPRDAAHYACFCVLAKFPQLLGVAMFYWNVWRGRDSEIIEYKSGNAGRGAPEQGSAI